MGKIAKVSVIVPTYNRSAALKQAIKSVSHQTYPVHEIVVVDDGSTDNTKSLISQISKVHHQIKYIKIRHSGLPAIARNAGITIATGEYIAFLDSDDIWDKNKLKIQIREMNKYNTLASATNAHIIDEGGRGRSAFAHMPQVVSLRDVKYPFR